jgi:hypothetical protein
MDDAFDNLRPLTDEEAGALGCGKPRSKPRRVGGEFIKFPRMWMERLRASRSLATYKVALCLLFRNWKARGRPFPLTNTVLSEERVSWQAKWRALRELEELGLIRVEERPNRSPLVTVLTG